MKSNQPKFTSLRRVTACGKLLPGSLLFIFAMCGLLMAQSTTNGAIGGTVVDPQKLPVPGAQVVVLSSATNAEYSVLTDPTGRFRVTNLQAGSYTVTASMSGFKAYRSENVLVQVGLVSTLEIPLSLGSQQEVVTVSGDAPIISTEQADFSSNINQTAINELPINGRRWSNFAILAPGSVPDGSFGLISFRGISGLLNNNTVDGGDNNQAFFSEERGRTRISYSISQSAIREFQVNTSNYSAEYGRAAGGVTNAVTKSGTNQLHGDFFYYQRNNSWGARNPLAFQTVLVNGVASRVGIKPDDVRHQYGGTLGGPIKKDKLFFFVSFDQQKRNFPGLGIFSDPAYLNNVNRAALTAANRGLTTAQIDDVLGFLTSLTGTVPRRGDQRIILPKIDWVINSKNTVTVNYNRLRWDSPAGIQTQATNTRGKASFGDDFVKIDWGTARWISTVTPKLVNEVRLQIARDFEFQNSQPPAPGEPRTAMNGSAPDVFLTNGLEFGKPTFLERPAYPKEKRIQGVDNVTYNLGGNILKFGADINHVHETLSNLRNESGAYSYNNINDFIIDYTNWKAGLPATVPCVNSTRLRGKCYTSNYAQGFGPPASEFGTEDYGLYAQFDWRFRRRLTFNLGLRYEYQTVPTAQFPYGSALVIPNTNLTLDTATTRLPKDRNNFGPRAGFAFDVFGDRKTALRGGYGIYYGRIINSTISNALVNTGAPGGQFQVSLSGSLAAAPIFPNVLATAPASTSAVQFFAPGFSNPLIHQADLSFEREIMRNTSVSASYLLSLGRRLPTFLDRNLYYPSGATQSFTVAGGPFDGKTATIPLFGTARPTALFAQMTEIASVVNSTYNAMVLQANRRFSAGLQFQVSYTLSKSEDTNQRSVTFTTNNVPYNVFDIKGENGRSNFDRRHKFIANAVYAPRVKADNIAVRTILDGWSLAPIMQIYTGLPYNGFVSGSFGGAGSLNRSGGDNRFPLIERNAFTGPKVVNVDLRVSRRFHIKERAHVEFFAEAFNIFNRTQITGLNETFYNLSGTTLNYNPSFGTINEAGGTLYRERQIQIAIRFAF